MAAGAPESYALADRIERYGNLLARSKGCFFDKPCCRLAVQVIGRGQYGRSTDMFRALPNAGYRRGHCGGTPTLAPAQPP